MWARRSKTIHLPSGEISTDIQVPSEVSKAISRVVPRGSVVSHFSSGLSFDFWSSSARAEAGSEIDARERRSKVQEKRRSWVIESLRSDEWTSGTTGQSCRLPT